MSEAIQDAPVVEDVEVEAEAETNAIVDEEQAEQQEAEPSESSTENTEEETGKKDGSSFQKRIDELTGKYRDTERDRDYWKLQAESLKQAQPEPEPVAPGKTLADFDYDEKQFSEYVFNQAREQALNAAKAETTREQQIRKQAEFKSKETIFSEEAPDYFQVTRNPQLRVTQEMATVIQDSPKGSEVLYKLGKNPELAAQIAELPPLAMAREIGYLEATLPKVSKKPPISKAPPPPPKVKGAGEVTTIRATDPNSDKLSTEEWFKRRQKQLAKR